MREPLPPLLPLLPTDPSRIGGYRLLGRLGAGGMGVVYLGRADGGGLAAVKAIRAEYAEEADFRARFRREVRAARRVRSPYVVALADAEPDAESPWLATEFVPGLSLAEAVGRYGPLPVRAVRVLGLALARALAAVHQAGLVHRDVKPANVLLAVDGPLLIDFGIARASDTTALTSTDMVVGTPGFLSPEQAQGRRATAASDVFALGCLLVYAATGRAPFGSGPVDALLYRTVHDEPDVRWAELGDPELAGLLRICLAKDPYDRPTPDALAAALAEGEGGVGGGSGSRAESGAGPGSGAGSGPGSGAGPGSGSRSGASAGPGSGSGPGSSASSGSGASSGADMESGAGGAGSGTGSDMSNGMGVEPGSGGDAWPGCSTGAGSGPGIRGGTGAGGGPGAGAGTGTGTGMESGTVAGSVAGSDMGNGMGAEPGSSGDSWRGGGTGPGSGPGASGGTGAGGGPGAGSGSGTGSGPGAKGGTGAGGGPGTGGATGAGARGGADSAAGGGWLPDAVVAAVAARAAEFLALPDIDATVAEGRAAWAGRRRFLLAGAGAVLAAGGGTAAWLGLRPGRGLGGPAPRRWTIGVHADLSGPGAAVGRAQERGVRLAVEAFNSLRGHPFTLSVATADDRGDAARAPGAAAALAADRDVLAVIGPTGDASAYAALDHYGEASLALVTVSAAGSGFGLADRRALLQTCPVAAAHAEAVNLQFVVGGPVRRLGVLCDRSGDSPAWETAFLADLSVGHYVPEATAHPRVVPRGETDYAPVVDDLLGRRLDGFLYTGAPPGAARVARLLRAAGFAGPRIADYPSMGPEFLRLAGPDAEGWQFFAPYTGPEAPEAAAVTAAHRRRYGSAPAHWTAEAYDVTLMVADRLARLAAGGDRPGRAELLAGLAKGTYRGLLKEYAFDGAGRIRGTVSILHRVEGGRVRYAGPAPARPRRRGRLAPGETERPERGGAERPAPGGAERPAPGGAERPAPGGAERSEPNRSARPEPGGAERPKPNRPARPEPGRPERPESGGPGHPAPGGAERPEPGRPAQREPDGPRRSTPGGTERPDRGGPTRRKPHRAERPEPGGPERPKHDRSARPEPGKPERPESGGPERPEPGGPGSSKPSRPGRRQPGEPGRSTPNGPERPEARRPERPEHGGPRRSAPGGPERPEPGGPGSSKPSRPGRRQPGEPGRSTPNGPERPEARRPERPEHGGPRRSAPGGPERPEPGGPGSSKPSRPGRRQPGGPGRSTPGEPDRQEPRRPERSEPGGPGRSVPGRPGRV